MYYFIPFSICTLLCGTRCRSYQNKYQNSLCEPWTNHSSEITWELPAQKRLIVRSPISTSLSHINLKKMLNTDSYTVSLSVCIDLWYTCVHWPLSFYVRLHWHLLESFSDVQFINRLLLSTNLDTCHFACFEYKFESLVAID